LQAVLVVNSTLKMSSGKVAAQCAHAAVGLYKNMYLNSLPWLAAWEVNLAILLPSWQHPMLPVLVLAQYRQTAQASEARFFSYG
jgi:hypothetical protein